MNSHVLMDQINLETVLGVEQQSTTFFYSKVEKRGVNLSKGKLIGLKN